MLEDHPKQKWGEVYWVSSPASIHTFDDFGNGIDTQPRYLQTTMNVSIFLSKLLIHSAHFFYLSTFLVRFLRA